MATECPQFEELSRLADKELDAARRDIVEAHLADCGTCAEMSRRLAAVPELKKGTRRADACAMACPGAETLIAYLAGRLGPEVLAAVEEHLNGCDACLTSLPLMRRSLAFGPESVAAVPSSVQQRAIAAFAAAPELPREDALERCIRGVLGAARGALATLTRIPVLVPVAVAAVAVLTIATQPQWFGGARDMSRSVHVLQHRKITVLQAPVRSQPSAHAQVVATLHRGDGVEVRDEERVWLRVTLADGTEGWVERSALE